MARYSDTLKKYVRGDALADVIRGNWTLMEGSGYVKGDGSDVGFDFGMTVHNKVTTDVASPWFSSEEFNALVLDFKLATFLGHVGADGNPVLKVKTASALPVAASRTIVLHGSKAVSFVAIVPGTDGNGVNVSTVIAGDNTPLTMTEAGGNISIAVATDADGNVVTTGAQLVALVNATSGYARASLAVDDSGSWIVSSVVTSVHLQNGADPVGLVTLLTSGTLVDGTAQHAIVDKLDKFCQVTLTLGDNTEPDVGVKATGVLTSDNTNFANAETITIGAKVYTIKTALTPAEGEILRGADADTTLANIKGAINHESTGGQANGTTYKCAAANADVSCGAVTAHAVTVTYKGAGNAAAQNVLATTETCAHAAWGSTHLVGGVDPESALLSLDGYSK